AKTLHSGRFEGDDDGAGNSEQLGAQSLDDRGGGVVVALPLLVRLEGQKDETGIGRVASEAEAGDGKSAQDFRKILGDGGDLCADVARVFERSSGGCLDSDDEVSLIFVGDEALRYLPEYEISKTESSGEEDQRHDFKTQERAERANVAVINRGQDAVDDLKEPIPCAVLTSQQEGGERGRKSERVEGGDRDGEGDGQRELAK